ncbi:MAG: VCBS repeat-containing protein [Planctomycetes bacterium]|nr:VCBS repeat-containing protein [Planctomycetota bacterium]
MATRISCWALVPTLAGTFLCSCNGGGGGGTVNIVAPGLSKIQFDARRDLKAGNGATNVALGDLDGDGRADLLVARYYDSKVSMFHSAGAGIYSSAFDLPFGPVSPIGVAVADVDADGNADAIVTDYNTGEFYIYRNSGAGLMNSPASFPTVLGAIGIAVADYDIDGLPDIAISGVTSSEIRIHRGLGSFTFGAGTSFPIHGIPVQLYSTDLDEDGRPDVVCSDVMTDQLRMLRNIPSSSNSGDTVDLVDYVTTDIGPSILGFAAGDLDGDHRPEFVTGSTTSTSIIVWKLDGSGMHAIATVANPTITSSLVLADFDGDGKLDLAAACPIANGVELWKGAGGGIFQNPIFRSTGIGPVFLAAGDSTGDGVADLHAAAATSGEVSIFAGRTGGGDIVDGPNAIFIMGQPILGSAADLDGDGANDLAVGDNDYPFVYILRNKGGFRFEMKATLAVDAPRAAHKPLLFDFDNNGTLDIAALSDGGATFYINDGTAVFTKTASTAVDGGLLLGVARDFDHDGFTDFAATAPAANAVAIFINHHSSFVISQLIPTGLAPAGIDAADFNRDGKLDIVAANDGDDTVRIVKHSGSGFSASATALATLAGPEYVYAADFGGDGRADLAVSHSSADDLLIFKNKGHYQFDEPTAVATNGRPVGLLVEDINKDGRKDLLYTEDTTGRCVIRLSDGHGGFAAPATAFAAQYDITCPMLSDLDGDGLPELITISSAAGLVDIHKNLSVK